MESRARGLSYIYLTQQDTSNDKKLESRKTGSACYLLPRFAKLSIKTATQTRRIRLELGNRTSITCGCLRQ